ncbi:glycosyltransferase WbuB [Frondihabitans sp. PAMC 28766]|uniref:glycosyltransferase n=1 Tax=Frondihabitans sp. PAMC 28766 TaxID=1795630 RepID=UPI00078B7BDC|nr:glycosyltransferase [Frondihabitans sp. PAMC 28766]AMM20471.1 glycosyltransferase WbuB [Frondihabitans sp. PAMC 28766]
MTVPPLKILIVGMHYAPETTGNAPYTSALAAGLKASGIQVRVITSHPHYPEWRVRNGYGQWKSSEVIRGVPVTRLKSFIPAKPSSLTRLISETTFGVRAAFARWGSPDVVLLVSPALFANAVITLLGRLLRRPVATGVWVQDLYSVGVAQTGASGAGGSAFVTRVESFVLRSADGVAVIHERFRQIAETRLGVQSARLSVIRNWSHLRPAGSIDRVETRRALGWADDEIIALHAGNMGVKQGLGNVVEAGRVADRDGSRVRFVFLGDGNQRVDLKRQATGIERIQFIDPLPDAQFQATLGSADVLLVNELAGVTEMSVPSKLTSYFSTGLPVVAATEVGSVTAGEVTLSGGGVHVQAGQPNALLETVLRVGGDRERAAEMGEAGRRFRDTHLSESHAIARFSDWLTGLASSDRG